MQELVLIHLSLFRPRVATRRLAREQPLMTAFLVLVLAALAECLGLCLVARTRTGAVGSLGALGLGTFLFFLRFCLGVLVGSIFLPAAGRMVGGRGNVVGLSWVLALSHAVWCVSLGAALVIQMTPYGFGLWCGLHLGLLVWMFWIHTHALAESHGLSTLRAAFATVLGYGLVPLVWLLTSSLGSLDLVYQAVLWSR